MMCDLVRWYLCTDSPVAKHRAITAAGITADNLVKKYKLSD
jgi:hypothetical protein